MPYWDWANPQQAIYPEDTLVEELDIIQPNSRGVAERMRNPLFAYEFKDGQAGKIGNFSSTFRHSQWNPEELAENLPKEFTKAFIEEAPKYKHANLTERVLYILQSYARYGPMSHDKFAGKGKQRGEYGSMEGIHNTIHNVTGGDGQMSQIDKSAFDPIFWLHHANIDRLFAIWQVLHQNEDPDTYVIPFDAQRGTFTTPANGRETAESFLTPFEDSNGTFWTSKDVVETTKFYYAYPETQKWKYDSLEAYRAQLVKDLIKLYPGASVGNSIQQRKLQKAAPSTAVLKSRVEAIAQVPLQQLKLKREIEDAAPGNQYTEWLTNLRAKKHALGTSYNVYIFLERVEERNPTKWLTLPHLVGVFAVLRQQESTGCEKCQRNQADETRVSGQIPLTMALTERYLAGKLDGLTPEYVQPYLQENLHWKVAKINGEEVSRGGPEDLLVAITTNKVTIPEDPNELPIYGDDVEVYPEIITKQDGATGRGDGFGLTHDSQL